jgi:hypothetical protein
MYMGMFESPDEIICNFDAPSDALDGAKVLLAWYDYQDYEGDAFVLYQRDGKLYEVHGGHYSCNGLEGQWSPRKPLSSLCAIDSQKVTSAGSGWTRRNTFAAELREVLDTLEVAA